MNEIIRGKKFIYVGTVYPQLVGREMMALSVLPAPSIQVICPDNAFWYVNESELKEAVEVKAPIVKDKIEDLIKLKTQFTADEILRLNRDGLI